MKEAMHQRLITNLVFLYNLSVSLSFRRFLSNTRMVLTLSTIRINWSPVCKQISSIIKTLHKMKDNICSDKTTDLNACITEGHGKVEIRISRALL